MPTKITLQETDTVVTYEVKTEEANGELIGAYSENKETWMSKGSDALSWFCAPHRSDYRFRDKMFGKY